jgi:hypothetical protein
MHRKTRGTSKRTSQQCQDEPRLPVVAVYDVGFEIQSLRNAKHPVSKIGKALQVVEVAAPGIPLKIGVFVKRSSR